MKAGKKKGARAGACKFPGLMSAAVTVATATAGAAAARAAAGYRLKMSRVRVACLDGGHLFPDAAVEGCAHIHAYKLTHTRISESQKREKKSTQTNSSTPSLASSLLPVMLQLTLKGPRAPLPSGSIQYESDDLPRCL